MAFRKAIQLIEKANEMEQTYRMLEEWGDEYCEPDELEARQDQAYRDHFDSCMELTRHLRQIMVESDLATVKEMAFSHEKREEMLDLFNSAI